VFLVLAATMVFFLSLMLVFIAIINRDPPASISDPTPPAASPSVDLGFLGLDQEKSGR